MIYKSRTSYAAIIRKARAEGTLTSYERDHWMGRCAVLSDGSMHEYEPAWQSMLDERDDAYERAAARARNNDFADTGGRDWT